MAEPQLIIVSNRAAFPDEKDGASGGLAAVLYDSLAKRGGMWLGAKSDPEASRSRSRDRGIEFRALPFMEEQPGHYMFSNSILWPAVHALREVNYPASVKPRELQDYQSVNKAFARETHALVRETRQAGKSSIVWIHDYQLLSTARHLREDGYKGVIGVFLHTTVPSPADLAMLPKQVEATVRGLYADTLHADQVAFQTDVDKKNYRDIMASVPGVTLTRDGLTFRGRDVVLETIPVGIDPDFYDEKNFNYNARIPLKAQPIRRASAGKNLIFTGGRVDPIKNLDGAMRGTLGLIRKRSALGLLTHLGIVGAGSRKEIPLNNAYAERTLNMVDDMLDAVSGSVSLSSKMNRSELPHVYRAANVGLFGSLADGWNLMTEEWRASQDAANPGVLVIGNRVGAATGLKGGLVFDPYKPDELTAALERALEMPLRERQARHETDMVFIRNNRAVDWFDRNVASLETLAQQRNAQPSPHAVTYDPNSIHARPSPIKGLRRGR